SRPIRRFESTAWPTGYSFTLRRLLRRSPNGGDKRRKWLRGPVRESSTLTYWTSSIRIWRRPGDRWWRISPIWSPALWPRPGRGTCRWGDEVSVVALWRDPRTAVP